MYEGKLKQTQGKTCGEGTQMKNGDKVGLDFLLGRGEFYTRVQHKYATSKEKGREGERERRRFRLCGDNYGQVRKEGIILLNGVYERDGGRMVDEVE
jgi:hypothetical protein